ncbi:hypothetical protein [Kaistia sp. MMO-174]|uniref:hypothetical protein n=1 Tax=Kaistia sp. MMO-174 TaxID=3081256 RepID=UPI00301AD3E0
MENEPHWHWRNCRDVGVSIHFFPLSWRLGFEREADVYGGDWHLLVGPLGFVLHANIGNCSSDRWLERKLGLSMDEAWQRSVRFEERADG